MTTVVPDPVRLTARLDAPLSRWLWLVKWLLVIPHLVVLFLLWVAFSVLSVVAFFAILITGRYPYAIFEFNLGVLRWTWRVAYYAYGALGTDRYPPFTLGEVPDYPATLDIAYPEHLSRGLVLVKWWLLVLPHYLVIAFFLGGGYTAYRAGAESDSLTSSTWTYGGGLIGLLALIAGIALLFTGRYPRGVFDLLLGMHRWVLRVAAYAGLMTDAYPPFRLDLGGAEPAEMAVTADPAAVADRETSPRTGSRASVTRSPGGPGSAWTLGRIISVVIGSIVLACALGAGAAGTAVLVADRGGRDADGFLGTGFVPFVSAGYALVFDPIELRDGTGAPDPGAVLGAVRIRAEAPGTSNVFVGVAPATDVNRYLASVDRERLVDLAPGGRPVQQRIDGGAPATPPERQTFWAVAAAGPGPQQVLWPAAPGRWAVVVMNADGSRPVVVELSAGATVPGLRWVWIGLFAGAGLGLLVGGLLVGLAVPRQRT